MEAEDLINELDRLLGYECDKKCSECIGCSIKDTFNEVKRALEKQIPKKPIIKMNSMTKHISVHCSICNTDITYYTSEENYCHNCGQALKWE